MLSFSPFFQSIWYTKQTVSILDTGETCPSSWIAQGCVKSYLCYEEFSPRCQASLHLDTESLSDVWERRQPDHNIIKSKTGKFPSLSLRDMFKDLILRFPTIIFKQIKFVLCGSMWSGTFICVSSFLLKKLDVVSHAALQFVNRVIIDTHPL